MQKTKFEPEKEAVLAIITAATIPLDFWIDEYSMEAALVSQNDEDFDYRLCEDLEEWDSMTDDIEHADTILELLDTVSGLSQPVLQAASKLRHARDIVSEYQGYLAEVM